MYVRHIVIVRKVVSSRKVVVQNGKTVVKSTALIVCKQLLQDCLFCFFFFAARKALEDQISPIIIDNTNSQTWEMKPYVSMVSFRFLRLVCEGAT